MVVNHINYLYEHQKRKYDRMTHKKLQFKQQHFPCGTVSEANNSYYTSNCRKTLSLQHLVLPAGCQTGTLEDG